MTVKILTVSTSADTLGDDKTGLWCEPDSGCHSTHLSPFDVIISLASAEQVGRAGCSVVDLDQSRL